MRPLALALSACMLAAAVPVGAQIYRWTDERGGITYGSHPPPGAARPTRLDVGASRQGSPGVPASRLSAVREPPGVAVPAPSTFPGTVDTSTVAAMGKALALQECGRSRVGCDHAIVAIQQDSYRELSALRVP